MDALLHPEHRARVEERRERHHLGATRADGCPIQLELTRTARERRSRHGERAFDIDRLSGDSRRRIHAAFTTLHDVLRKRARLMPCKIKRELRRNVNPRPKRHRGAKEYLTELSGSRAVLRGESVDEPSLTRSQP